LSYNKPESNKVSPEFFKWWNKNVPYNKLVKESSLISGITDLLIPLAISLWMVAKYRI
jgi:hypothetical protein